ncbi:MAG: methyltransferase domain-containing protein [Thermoproteota archaeon]
MLEFYEYRPNTPAVPGLLLKRLINSCRTQRGTTSLHWAGVHLKCRSSERCLEVAIYDTSAWTPLKFHGRIALEDTVNLKDERMYIVTNAGLLVAEARTPGKYIQMRFDKLSSTPYLVINGVQMHRIMDTDPLTDARLKVAAAGVKTGSRVLEIGTGLGYTTTASIERGALRIVSVEIDEHVIKLSEHNPMSRNLSSDKVSIIVGNAAEVVKSLRSNYFDTIIHDPPRFQMAGELYSREFYAELYRVLKSGGTLFHYTGEPMRGRGRGRGPIVAGVIRRLNEVGFQQVKYIEKAQGVVARKLA